MDRSKSLLLSFPTPFNPSLNLFNQESTSSWALICGFTPASALRPAVPPAKSLISIQRPLEFQEGDRPVIFYPVFFWQEQVVCKCNMRRNRLAYVLLLS